MLPFSIGGSEAEILEKVSRLEKQVEDLANRLAVPTQDQVPKKNIVRHFAASVTHCLKTIIM